MDISTKFINTYKFMDTLHEYHEHIKNYGHFHKVYEHIKIYGHYPQIL